MKDFLKKHLIDLLLIVLVSCVVGYAGKPLVTLEQWDYIATMGWAVLPLALV